MILMYVDKWEVCGCKDQMSLADAGKDSSLTKRDESMTIGGAHLKVDYAEGSCQLCTPSL
jgi:hypothetical protein